MAVSEGVSAKDLILHVIRTLGVKGGVGYAYEFAGSAIAALSMEERMTLCNMAIEGVRWLCQPRCGDLRPRAGLRHHPARPGIGLCSGGARWSAMLMPLLTMKCLRADHCSGDLGNHARPGPGDR